MTYNVGILNYNTRDLLLENIGRCLGSGIPIESLMVLDNHSTDGSPAAVKERFPRVRLVVSPVNLGYAGGMNKIVELSETNLVVLVTADCFVTLDTVQRLVASVGGGSEIAVVGCRIIDNRTGNIQSEGADITYPLGVALARNWQESKDTPAKPGLVECAYVQGAAMLVDASKFREIGCFDESYFAYYEDVDLCWRARLRGYRVAALGSAVGLHVTFGSFGSFPARRRLLSERNRIATNIKNLDPTNLLVSLSYEALYFLTIALGASIYGMPAYRIAYFGALVSLLRMRTSILRERRRVQRERQRPDMEVLECHPKIGFLTLLRALSQRLAITGSDG